MAIGPDCPRPRHSAGSESEPRAAANCAATSNGPQAARRIACRIQALSGELGLPVWRPGWRAASPGHLGLSLASSLGHLRPAARGAPTVTVVTWPTPSAGASKPRRRPTGPPNGAHPAHTARPLPALPRKATTSSTLELPRRAETGRSPSLSRPPGPTSTLESPSSCLKLVRCPNVGCRAPNPPWIAATSLTRDGPLQRAATPAHARTPLFGGEHIYRSSSR